ncbi:CLUMA_CG006650, isoform A [Clunio marinus]|uniref:CLUMA_CG006650, isoform A n=1 Tax=Clunio marinus TaxID=568069 RepID=A0A1J1I422_9DIPT|nr:CLUMA_CG006650, isoform A [Clunio marinus]
MLELRIEGYLYELMIRFMRKKGRKKLKIIQRIKIETGNKLQANGVLGINVSSRCALKFRHKSYTLGFFTV